MSHSKPYKDSSLNKKGQISAMFDSIAPSYDKGNRILSFGIDQAWRKSCIKKLQNYNPKRILDVATGTGDLAIACIALSPQKIVGVDLSPNMLAEGKQKVNQMNLGHMVTLEIGDAENLPFPASSFDAVVVAFGFRNYENRQKGLSEAYRVLTKEGRHLILEFSRPRTKFWKWIYGFYLTKMLPEIGGWISKQKSAYQYLNDSIHSFPSRQEIIEQMRQAGFTHISCTPLSGGICCIWSGEKS